jgi:hypothetical protein
MSAFDVQTQMWLEKARADFDPVVDAVRCPQCLRAIKNGTAEDLVGSCRNARPHSPLPCHMAVNLTAEKTA